MSWFVVAVSVTTPPTDAVAALAEIPAVYPFVANVYVN
jgi:hypothetical protein